MKKVLLVSLILIFALASVLSLVACGDDTPPPKPKYTVTLKYGSRVLSSFTVEEGAVIAPYLEGKQAEWSWYTSKTGGIEWNVYQDKVMCDTTLYRRISE